MEGTEQHRPMRRAKREVTDPTAIKSIIDRCQVVRVASQDAEGLFVMPLNFGYTWDLAPEDLAFGNLGATADTPASSTFPIMPTFWLHSAAEGRKADAWRANPAVALEMDVEGGVITGDYSCAYSFAFESVMAQGTVHEVTGLDEKRRGLALIMEHMSPGAPVKFADAAVERVAIWRVDVNRLTAKLREAKRPKA